MIPPEVRAIADIILPGWYEHADDISDEVIGIAWRVYNAGYRLPPGRDAR